MYLKAVIKSPLKFFFRLNNPNSLICEMCNLILTPFRIQEEIIIAHLEYCVKNKLKLVYAANTLDIWTVLQFFFWFYLANMTNMTVALKL